MHKPVTSYLVIPCAALTVVVMEIRRVGQVGLPVALPEARAQIEQNVSVFATAAGGSRSLAAELASGTKVVTPAPKVVRRRRQSEKNQSSPDLPRGAVFDRRA